MTRGSLGLAGILASVLVLPFVASAAVIIEQPLFDEIELNNGNTPLYISGPSTLSGAAAGFTGVSGTVRQAKFKLDWLTGGAAGVQVVLNECSSTPGDELQGCRYNVARDASLGWDGGLIYLPDVGPGNEITVDFTSTTDFAGHEHVDGVPLIPTRNYTLQIMFSNNIYTANLYGRSILSKFNSYYQLNGDSATSTATTTPPCTIDCNSNVMFLPGIEASRLFATSTDVLGFEHENQLWEPNVDGDVRKLFLKPDGSTALDGVYVHDKGVIDETVVPVAGVNVYKSFIATMDGLVDDEKINEWTPVAYDWRLSLDDILNNGNQYGGNIYFSGTSGATTSPYILQELRRLASTSRTEKVTIIAHSNGGLVAKRLMQMLGNEGSGLVDKVIFVAVPQLGTPMAIPAGMHGYEQSHVFGLVTAKHTARTLASTSPMFYHLLPSAQYYATVDDPVVTINPETLPEWFAHYGDTIHSTERLRNFVIDPYGKVDPMTGDIDSPVQLSSSLFAEAEVLHATLDAWAPPQGVELTQIAGWGVGKTVSGVTYTMENGKVSFEPTFTVDGDGTVVVPSAHSSSVSRYWLDLDEFNNRLSNNVTFGFLSTNHASVLEVPGLIDFLSDIVTSNRKSIDLYEHLESQAPLGITERLRYELHSPLSLDLFDAMGRHTGVSTTTGLVEEQIPGTYYAEFGEKKYIFSDASSSAHIRMSGYGSSTFTFKVTESVGDDVRATTTWKDLPVTPGTEVGIDVESGIETLSSLSIDLDGDGDSEIALAPKLNSIVTLDTSAPTTAISITGTLGENDWYVSPVEVSIAAADNESGVASTTITLNGFATTSNSFSVGTSGVHSIVFFSEDNAGNVELPNSADFKIDGTYPELVLGVDLFTKDLGISGIDTVSSTTVKRTSSGADIVDEAGNTTTLVMRKSYTGRLLSAAQISGIKYGQGASTSLAASFVYLWDSSQKPVSQTVAVDKSMVIQALYDKKKNRTTIVVLEKGRTIQSKIVPGLAIIKLTTDGGKLKWGW